MSAVKCRARYDSKSEQRKQQTEEVKHKSTIRAQGRRQKAKSHKSTRQKGIPSTVAQDRRVSTHESPITTHHLLSAIRYPLYAIHDKILLDGQCPPMYNMQTNG